MIYLFKRGINDLSSVIAEFEHDFKELRETYEKNKASVGQYFSDSDLDLGLVEMKERDLCNLKTVKELIEQGECKQALEYSARFDTAIRDSIPVTTYELMGGGLIHDSDKTFTLKGLSKETYYEKLNDIAAGYANKNIPLAEHLERQLYKWVGILHKTPAIKAKSQRELLIDCLNHLKTLEDADSKKLVRLIKRNIN